MAKDKRFIKAVLAQPRKTKVSVENESAESKLIITGNDIANNTILANHLASGAITNEKLSSISIPQPFHCSDHLSTTTSGWVRVAQLNNLSAVEFWVKVTVSGNHNIAKFVGTYCFMGSGTPQVTFNMISNARFGNGFTDARIITAGTYDRVFFELYLPQPAYIAVGQISAFGSTINNYSNITLTGGSIPAGYSSLQQYIGGYDSAMLMR